MLSSKTLFDDVAFTQDQARISSAIDLRHLNPGAEIYFHLSFSATGSPTVTITYTVCDTEGGTYFNPNTGTNNRLVATQAETTGTILTVPATVANFRPHNFMKITITEDNVAAIDNLTGILIIVNDN